MNFGWLIANEGTAAMRGREGVAFPTAATRELDGLLIHLLFQEFYGQLKSFVIRVQFGRPLQLL